MDGGKDAFVFIAIFFFPTIKKKITDLTRFCFVTEKRYGSILDVAIGKTVGRR